MSKHKQMKLDKIIVANKAAIEKKYGANASKIFAALNALKASDKKKKLTCDIFFVDDAKTMQDAGGKAVDSTNASAAQCKPAVDALYKTYQPDYICLIGAPDIFPHVSLANPVFGKRDGDDDARIDSDLPYACDKKYSTKANDFVSPTRVLSRLPDIKGEPDPTYLVGLINNAIKSKPAKASSYKDYFGLSVLLWQKSTEESLDNIFAGHSKLSIAPTAGPKFSKAQLNGKLHFINCHGSPSDPNFYGQKGKDFPPALNTTALKGKISFGTAVAAECCYGAQLYMYSDAESIPICNNYLAEGALGFAGSTNIAYGPAAGQGLADLITQYFLINVRNGASLGRAFLEVSQPDIDPHELKTLAQFNLLGDPSVCLVESLQPKNADAKKSKSFEIIASNQRSLRRHEMQSKGAALGNGLSTPSLTKRPEISSKLKKELNEVLKEYKFETKQTKIFTNQSAQKNSGKALGGDVKFHVYEEKTQTNKKGITDIKVLVVKEVGGNITGVKEYVSR
jgi:hypothetical protein